MLNINLKNEEKNLNVILSGRLDTNTSPELEEKVKNNINNIEELVFDLKDLSYVSSAGLRVFLLAQKIMNKQGKMIVKNVSEEVKEIFTITGFSDILTLE